MERKLLFLATSWILAVAAALAVLAGTAAAVSFLKVDSGPDQVTDGAPPCNATRTTTFKVTLRNDNGPLFFCSEDVKPVRQPNVIEGFLNEFEIKQHPQGSLKFLGFKLKENDPPTDKLEFTVKSTVDLFGGEVPENKVTFFFDVETGPVVVPVLGTCDFEDAETAIVICDGGGSCDIVGQCGGDPPDPFCESPGKFVLSVRLDSDKSSCPASTTGTARIQGTVRDGDGRRMANASVHVTRGCRGQASFVDQTTTTPNLPLDQRGSYTLSGLPGATDYTVEARADGRCATATVSVSAGAAVTQDFTLTNSCN